MSEIKYEIMPPLSFGHLPQIKQIWGRLRFKSFGAISFLICIQ